MRILIVEDEEKLAQSIKKGLEAKGHAVDYVLDGQEGEQRAEMFADNYDLLILDLMLPKKNGFEVCKSLRDKGLTFPILILTARDTIEDKVLVLDNGADDYLVKPFSFEELSARMRALMRRPTDALPTELQIKDLRLNPSTREVYRGEKKIDLTLKEFEMLNFLMRHPGQVKEREEIFTHLWDFASNALSNVIDVHMKNLRKKIDDGYDEKLLETVRGVGYKIEG
ncbi:MAG: DNA-binding response regulator [Candidatus Harrisonbacteria bacterium CG10_big_fil_rev_8_21_14_0_10_49_15]|uniref:DNA-binding response regulator n=1 Tax=Candidatus Harrisonbacteria bacterium CG10_big_fil_rev_8_21_14_0_10_49_15 TaxID=1974587 RepID=A0A2H0UJQ1_9BACT|nr:MAG: DNA-binding response regulator [Candidatus Harrisonbacteria bacterium CG10_big_fil_rev_8_21_14_0_10_49_15]